MRRIIATYAQKLSSGGSSETQNYHFSLFFGSGSPPSQTTVLRFRFVYGSKRIENEGEATVGYGDNEDTRNSFLNNQAYEAQTQNQ